MVANEDPFTHTFTVDPLDIDQALARGESVEVQIPEEAGTHISYCVPHTVTPKQPNDEDMAGELEIRSISRRVFGHSLSALALAP